MKTILMTAIKTSISEVMETMFYLPVEFKEESTGIQSWMDEAKPIFACQLGFNGDFLGRLALLIPKDLLGEMTENFMGEPQEFLEDEHLSGTLTEMLNMVCGNALSKIESKVPFELDIPKMINATKIPASESFIVIETARSMMALHIAVDGLQYLENLYA